MTQFARIYSARTTGHITNAQLLDYRGSGLSPEEISADLRRRFVEWTGWPANEIHAGLIPGKGY
ncbi:MAG: hypothetical protein KIT19_06930 [Phycisphaeraceae bacterium]|nr:hypothetical protein [Phycisphaeraceae bacterium]